MTDGGRVFWVGQISCGSENSPYAVLMHTKDAKTQEDVLYCLHEQNFDEVYSIFSVNLAIHMARIKDVVATWNEQDKLLASDCTTISFASPDSHRKVGVGACSAIPTAGLIGLLSGGDPSVFSIAAKWREAFACADANFVGGTVAQDNSGVYFSGGMDHGLFWPVSAQGQDHRYEAANAEHTVFTTIAVNGTPSDDIVVMAEKMRLLLNKRSVKVDLQVLHNKSGKFTLRCVADGLNPSNADAMCEPSDSTDVVRFASHGQFRSREASQRARGVLLKRKFDFHSGTGREKHVRDQNARDNAGTVYQLTLVFQGVRKNQSQVKSDGAKPWVTLYVNGEKVSVLGRSKVGMAYFPDIQHFYVGGDNAKVTNALLYNRELSGPEVKQLFDNMGKIKLSERVKASLASNAFDPINVTYTE
ncbi:hypothetical protein ERJ75_000070600 [Trypanosoma vivax]|nr:hypothetical protein ERJ75_000070600 [Trypanosoma vivax]